MIEKLEEKKKLLDKHDNEIARLRDHLKQKQHELKDVKETFKEQCWHIKVKYDSQFKEAFEGFRHSKDKFMEKCIKEVDNNTRELYSLEEIQQRKISVFNAKKDPLQLIPIINAVDSFDKREILEKKIIGKEDVDIADLISRLNISDWVRQGHFHSLKSNGVCPFCQQELPKNFRKKLDEYFNDSYNKMLNELQLVSTQYKDFFKTLFEEISRLERYQNSYFDYKKIDSFFQIIKSQYGENLNLIEQKEKEPSRSISITSVQQYIDKINEEIKEANKEIEEHNELLKNLKVEQNNLISDIWRFIVEENKNNYEVYKQKSSKTEKAIQGINESIEKKEKHRRDIEIEISRYEQELTSIKHSINEINSILSSYGFDSFKLSEAERGNYKIIRDDGSEAEDTLSEGEKTFVTFLYFYQLIKGSNNEEQILANKIVVIDDPISSLDSNVLFVVSSLIRKLIDEIRENQSSNLKQIIILTHNVYFHKEVSFNKGKGTDKLKDETFWIIRKINNKSYLKRYNENPIKTSYELLWKELTYLKHEKSVTIQNVMRRILENYFRFFGNINIDTEVDKFAEEDRIVCRSLLSWVNDGSHHINEDLYVESGELNERYLKVFKDIFYNLGHGSHYEMMMGGCEVKYPDSEKELV